MRTCIGASLDIIGIAQELAEAVARFADFVSVELLEPVFRSEMPPGVAPDGRTVLRPGGADELSLQG